MRTSLVVVAIAAILLFSFGGVSANETVVSLPGKTIVKIPGYSQIFTRADEAICVVIPAGSVEVTACFLESALDAVAESNGFLRYGDLPKESKAQLDALPDDRMVFVEGGFGWAYATDPVTLGSFDVHEATSVLCEEFKNSVRHPAVCYFAAAASISTPTRLSVFISAELERPPGRSGVQEQRTEEKIGRIHQIIESIEMIPGSGSGKLTLPSSERPLHIEVADFNFDGHEDFAVWHLDDGMGVHKIYRIFLYTPGQKTFEEALSRCGDTFINVRRDLRRRRLLSTHWSDNTPMSCVTRLPKTPGGHAQK